MDACQEYEGLISAFIDGELDEADQTRLMTHMAACAACQRYFDDQIAIHDALESLEAQAPAGFAQSVMDRVRATPQERPREEKKRIVFPGWRRWAALVACCALAAGVWAFGPGGRDAVEESVVQYARDAAPQTKEAVLADAAQAPAGGAAEDTAEAPQSAPVESGASAAQPERETEPAGAAAKESAPEAAVPEEAQAWEEDAAADSTPPAANDTELMTRTDEGEDAVPQLFQAAPEDGAAVGYAIAEVETVAVTITAWRDEGFTAQVTDPGTCAFLQAGDEVLVRFETGAEVFLADGTVFVYDGEAPNAPDRGLAAGAAVSVTFASWEPEPVRLYAVAITEQVVFHEDR